MRAETPEKARIADVDISATNYDEVRRLLCDWGRGGAGGYVCICNVHNVMIARDDPDYAAALNGAEIATPDGMPLVWALRRMGYRQARVYGPDLLLAFAAHAAQEAEPVRSYFYGGAPGVAEDLGAKLARRFPGLSVAGCESPPFRELSAEEDAAAVARINDSGAHVCWVGLGAPKQERWMAAHADRVEPVMVGIGAAFDFLTGRVRQAPRWMMRLGLEWFFRLGAEPRRLWRRYLYYNPRFLWYLWRHDWRETA